MATRLEAKRPLEVINYSADWSEFLGEDTIASSVIVDDEGVTVSDSNDDTTVTLTISGGTNGTPGKFTNRITTAGGLTEEETFYIFVSNFAEPVSVAELKEHIGLWADTTRDAYIASLGRAAREYCERATSHTLMRRQFTAEARSFESVLLYNRPVVTVDAITYDDSDGVEQTLAEADYRLRARVWPGRIMAAPNVAFPSVWADGGVSAVFTAGYDEGEVPEPFVQAIKMLVAHWFSNREGVMESKTDEAPLAVRALLGQFDQPAFA
jgi:uncharacterized phiE125 gp8 family phage protein